MSKLEQNKSSRCSSTFNEILSQICDNVRKDLGYSDGEACEKFMIPYEKNFEPYPYDVSDMNYTPQFLDMSDCPSTPEEVETQFQSILSPYGIQYIRPQLKYVPTYEPNYEFNNEETFNWTKREENYDVVNDIVNYVVDNFQYEEEIPLTTYPKTKFSIYLDGFRLPDLDVVTHEFRHLVDLPVFQNLLYIYALNEFRKMDWALRAVRDESRCKADLKAKLDRWIGGINPKALDNWLKANQKRLDFMENEMTLGQHCFNNIPLIKQIYDYYLPEILK